MHSPSVTLFRSAPWLCLSCALTLGAVLAASCGRGNQSLAGEYTLVPFEVALESEGGLTRRRIIHARLVLEADGRFEITDRIDYLTDGATTRSRVGRWTGQWVRAGDVLKFSEMHSPEGLREPEHHYVMGFQWSIQPDGNLTGDEGGRKLVYRRAAER